MKARDTLLAELSYSFFFLEAPLHHPLLVPIVICDPVRFNSTEDNVVEGS